MKLAKHKKNHFQMGARTPENPKNKQTDFLNKQDQKKKTKCMNLNNRL